MKYLRSNVLIYCDCFSAMLEFYQRGMQLPVRTRKDWFVEFELNDHSFVSVIDRVRTTVQTPTSSVTLSWQVADLNATIDQLHGRGITTSQPKQVWGCASVFLTDPAGTRIELWQRP